MCRLSISCYIVFLSFVCSVYTKECPIISTVSNFDPAMYLGKWYQIESYPQAFEMDTECVTATYTLNPNGTVGVLNQAILKTTKTKIEIRGYATPNPTNPANLTVTFPGVPKKGKYWVIDTDYSSYSLVYSCELDMFDKRRENAYILSRTPQLSTRSVDKLVEELAAVKSDVSLFKKTDQTDCPKFDY